MAFSQRLEIRQSHALVMTPQLMQAIKLLQLSNLDLVAYVDQEVESNPLLERAEATDNDPGDFESDARPGLASDEGPASDDRPAAADHAGDAVMPAASETDDVPFADNDTVSARHNLDATLRTSDWSNAGPSPVQERDYNPEEFISSETTLADHLSGQLAIAVVDPVRRMIGQYLINMLDETGYLTADLAQVAERLGTPLREIHGVLAILQTLDPPGVCARNLS